MEEYETKEFLKMLGHDFDNNNKEYIKKYVVKCATGIATNGVPAFFIGGLNAPMLAASCAAGVLSKDISDSVGDVNKETKTCLSGATEGIISNIPGGGSAMAKGAVVGCITSYGSEKFIDSVKETVDEDVGHCLTGAVKGVISNASEGTKAAVVGAGVNCLGNTIDANVNKVDFAQDKEKILLKESDVGVDNSLILKDSTETSPTYDKKALDNFNSAFDSASQASSPLNSSKSPTYDKKALDNFVDAVTTSIPSSNSAPSNNSTSKSCVFLDPPPKRVDFFADNSPFDSSRTGGSYTANSSFDSPGIGGFSTGNSSTSSSGIGSFSTGNSSTSSSGIGSFSTGNSSTSSSGIGSFSTGNSSTSSSGIGSFSTGNSSTSSSGIGSFSTGNSSISSSGIGGPYTGNSSFNSSGIGGPYTGNSSFNSSGIGGSYTGNSSFNSSGIGSNFGGGSFNDGFGSVSTGGSNVMGAHSYGDSFYC